MNKDEIIRAKLKKEISAYNEARSSLNHELCVLHLGRAHILSQFNWEQHVWVHILMYRYAWNRKDHKELAGQLLRLLVTIPGHIIGRIPWGNTGWSNVPLTKKLPIPEDLKNLF